MIDIDWIQEIRAEQINLGDITVEILQQELNGRPRVLVTPFRERRVVACRSLSPGDEPYRYNAMVAVPVDKNVRAIIKGMARASGYEGPINFNDDGQIKSALDDDDEIDDDDEP